jgi:hypothetical protein
MRFRLRDLVSLLGFVSLALSIFTGSSVSLANVRGGGAAAPQQHALSSDGMGGGMKPPESLRLNMDGRDIVTIYATGDVRLADDLSVDEAAHEFWRKVGALAPDFCRARAAKAD